MSIKKFLILLHLIFYKKRKMPRVIFNDATSKFFSFSFPKLTSLHDPLKESIQAIVCTKVNQNYGLGCFYSLKRSIDNIACNIFDRKEHFDDVESQHGRSNLINNTCINSFMAVDCRDDSILSFCNC